MPRPDLPESRSLHPILRALHALRTAWWLLGITLLLLVGLELGLRLAFTLKDIFLGLEHPDPRLIAGGYDGEAWARTFFRENRQKTSEWHPYVYFRMKPFRGETINIDARGLRKSWQPPRERSETGRPQARVWIFGGSAAWGVGSRDDFTIPSLIAKDLEARGIAAEVTNFGEIGYVSTQEVIALMLELRAGRRPDLVVFYDGVNDVLAAYQNGQAGWPQNEANRRREFADRRSPYRLVAAGVRTLVLDSAMFRLAEAIRWRLMTGRAPAPRFPSLVRGKPDANALTENVLDTYAANRRLVHALADDYDFRALFYWQPVLFTKKHLTAFERGEAAKYADFAPLLLAVYRRARDRASRPGDDFQDLSGVLDSSERLLFTDFCHTTEAANAIVARRIAGDVARLLPSRPGGRTAETGR